MRRGLLLVISGFSGTGKGTVIRELLLRNPDDFVLSISATTRPPREGEIDGREYFFKTVEEFKNMISAGDLLEYTMYIDNYYGTSRKHVEDLLESGKDVILEIEIEGALNIKKADPSAVLIFLLPPSIDELNRRLTARGTESGEVVRQRIERAKEEIKFIDKYTYAVVNEDIDDCIKEIKKISYVEKLKVTEKEDFISEIKNDLAQI